MPSIRWYLTRRAVSKPTNTTDTLPSPRPATRPLSSIEIMLDEADYDGEDHRDELERMLGLLNSSSSYEELERHPEYQQILERPDPVRSFAA